MPYSYQIIRSSRKTISLEIKPDGTLLVRAPQRLSKQAVERFLLSKDHWIREKLQKYEHRPALPPLTESELDNLKKQAKADLAARVARYAPLVGISYGRITVRAQKTRWGSCTRAGNLNFNCLLMLCPDQVRNYVVIHELCHRKEMNHSARFWAEVAKVCPGYGACRRWLKENGGALIARLPE